MPRLDQEVLEILSERTTGVLDYYATIFDESAHFEIPGGGVVFEDTSGTKPYAARVSEPIILRQRFGRMRELGQLTVIALNTGDGTGDEQHGLTMEDIGDFGFYPATPSVVPRSKSKTPWEIHFPILRLGSSGKIDNFHGTLDRIGMPDPIARKLATTALLGAKHPTEEELMHIRPEEILSYTTGYAEHPELGKIRFGDPHAIHNGTSDLIVAGFMPFLTDDEHTQFLSYLMGNAHPRIQSTGTRVG